MTKLYNAGKFVLSLPCGEGTVSRDIDLDFLIELDTVSVKATSALEVYDHTAALTVIETFFWKYFTGNYIELVKARARSQDDTTARDSAVHALRIGLSVLLRLFAPFLPFIAEEI